MDVHWDGWRKNGAVAYNRLTRTLNQHIEKDGETMGRDSSGDPLTVGDIYNEMNALREFIGTALAMFDESKGIKHMDLKLLKFSPER